MYYATFTERTHTFIVAATEQGLCYVDIAPEKHFYQWVVKWFAKDATVVRNDIKLRPYMQQLMQYLRGERKTFALQLHFLGTPFQQKVWRALLTIPYGSTRSYSEIAAQINQPTAVRAVANAIGQNPLLFIVPCHRVIRKNGELAGFRSGIQLKQFLLQMEKVNR